MNSSKTKKPKYHLLDFKEFPPILGQPIIIDKNTIIYRTYDIQYGALERPSFFGEHSVSSRYLKEGRQLSAFVTKRKIKLLDIRYVIHIINQLILLREDNDFDKMIIGYKTLALSFGLVSLRAQLELYKERYRDIIDNDERFKKMEQYYQHYQSSHEKFTWQNPVELSGIRIGETNNDIKSTLILKEIFGEFFDGIIFPETFSPYFDDNKIPNEILLFEPSQCVAENKKNILILDTNRVSYLNILDIIKKNGINTFSVPYFMKNHKHLYFQYGGGSNYKSNPNYIFEKNQLIHIYCDTHKQEVRKLKKIGQLFKRELFDTRNVPRINYMNERNDGIAARASMELDSSGWKR